MPAIPNGHSKIEVFFKNAKWSPESALGWDKRGTWTQHSVSGMGTPPRVTAFFKPSALLVPSHEPYRVSYLRKSEETSKKTYKQTEKSNQCFNCWGLWRRGDRVKWWIKTKMQKIKHKKECLGAIIVHFSLLIQPPVDYFLLYDIVSENYINERRVSS